MVAGTRRGRQRRDRLLQPALAEQRRADAAGQVAQLGERALRLLARLAHELCRAACSPACELLLGAPEVHRDGDDPRLRAVVEVALDPLELQPRGVDRSRAGLLEVLDALLELALAGAEQTGGQRRADVRRAVHEQREQWQQQQPEHQATPAAGQLARSNGPRSTSRRCCRATTTMPAR